MEEAVCSGCITDPYLSEIIEEQGKKIECSVCGESDHEAVSVEELGKIMEPVMREHFRLGGEVKMFGENEDEWWEQDGESLSDIVQDVLGQYFDFHDDIVSAIVDADPAWPPDGDEPYWDTTSNYVPVRAQVGYYSDLWRQTLHELKHGRRFFSPAAGTFFEEIFEEIDTLQAWEDNALQPVVHILPAGTVIYRARICESRTVLKDMLDDPMKQVGPPPSAKARAGRMNAEGITVLYAAREPDTGVAEMRPALGSEVALIGMRTKRDLKILDFPRLERARSSKSLSYFQPDFSEQVARHAFLRRLHGLISKPIVPGNEADYLITQTMAEYLAHVHDEPFDGILFSSVQREGGSNIVLFGNPDIVSDQPSEAFDIEYVDGSFKLVRMTAIHYTHDDLSIYVGPDNELWVSGSESDDTFEE